MTEDIIMLVEDNKNDEILTLRALKKSNILNEVVVARDGQEALDYLFGTGKFADQPQRRMPVLIMLDIKLPKLSGHEVLQAVRSNAITKLLQVVMLTSSQQEQDVFESYNLGANSYIVKPVDFTQFNESIRQLGLYWLLLNQRPTLG